MANDKKMDKKVEQITDMEVDFAQWYTDICRKAELVEYASVKGFTILRPYGYAIWENMQRILDGEFKKTSHENVAMPVLIPESLLKKEGELVNGFAPEVAWVTMGGSEKLEERLAFRPTSETMFCDHWSRVLHSYRELPMLYNQWCSVIRWEKTTRPFLRSREFWWQEGHTIHETAEEAQAETEQQLQCYADFYENVLAIPVIPGRKTDKEKFAGAEATYTVECMMKDHKALQGATSHYFGDKFSRAYNVTFAGRDNKLQYPFQTSWGSTTRMIGAVIMAHGDNNGLALPPKIAPIQVIVVPVAQHKPGVIEGATALKDRLLAAGVRAKIDVSDNSLGWKCAEYEMKGVPLRLEMGPRDMENNQCVLVRRDNGEKAVISVDELEAKVQELLEAVHNGLYEKAKKNLDEHIYEAHSLAEAKELQEKNGGFIKTMWCGDEACEVKMKEEGGMSSRCLPFHQEHIDDVCPICGRKAVKTILWGVAY
ncbi:MAG: proline--tRNA ligase [Oscillospiraceae bacterium]|nr:proline--tRNA ligase [Oscillospiraceae bacterium]